MTVAIVWGVDLRLRGEGPGNEGLIPAPNTLRNGVGWGWCGVSGRGFEFPENPIPLQRWGFGVYLVISLPLQKKPRARLYPWMTLIRFDIAHTEMRDLGSRTRFLS